MEEHFSSWRIWNGAMWGTHLSCWHDDNGYKYWPDLRGLPYFSIVIWSVQREKGLNKTIEAWIEKVYSKNNKAELHIFAIKKF